MKNTKSILFALSVFISGVVYAITLCPTVEFIDSGELALAAKNLGIAHPTGYPLYTLFGRIAALIPWNTLIIKVNFLSLLFTSFAVGFLYLLLSEILSLFKDLRNRHYSRELISWGTALFVAFSPVWWSQGTTNEVYSLNLILIALAIWAMVKSLRVEMPQAKWLILSSYTLGLSLTNHLSAIYLIPGFIYIIVIELIKARDKGRLLIFLILFFIIPATLYLFLPIRAQYKPFLNWGGVSDPNFFFNHISGWQYRIWMFDKPLEAFGRIGSAARLLMQQYGFIGLSLVLGGIVFTAIKLRKIFIFAILVIVLNLIYVLNYEITDIESYYLPMILIFAIFMTIGFYFLYDLLSRRLKNQKAIEIIPIIVFIALAFSNLLANFHESDRSGKTYAREGSLDILKSMAPKGLALVENWDFYSPYLYLHFENNINPDRVMLDKELMRRSWYIDFIRRLHPDIYNRSKREFDEFLRRVEPFERSRPFDPEVIDQAYYGMLHAVIAHESINGPVYTNIQNDSKLLGGSIIVPDGVLFRFVSASEFWDSPRFLFNFAYWNNKSEYKDKRVAYLLSFYAHSFDSRMKYCEYFKKNDEAEYYQGLLQKTRTIISAIQESDK